MTERRHDSAPPLVTRLQRRDCAAAPPPHDLGAEKAVLSSLMQMGPDASREVLAAVNAQDFYHPSHQILFSGISAVHDSGRPVDLITLSEHLTLQKQLDAVGGPVALAELADFVATTVNVDHHVRIVRDKAIERERADLLRRAAADYSQEIPARLAALDAKVAALAAGSTNAFESDDAGHTLSVPSLSAKLDLTQLRRERYQLRGELLVRCSLAGAATLDDVLSIADVNLSSARSRAEHASHLAERARTDLEPWSAALEELAQRALAAERTGSPDVDLASVTAAPARVLEVAGLRLPAAHPAVLFGDGDSAKSYLTLYILGELACRGLRVGLADWELDAPDHGLRLTRLFPAEQLPAVRYLRCERAIVHEADRLRRWVREQKLDYVAFDSVAYASAGAPESAEIAMAYFQVVRSLGAVGTLHVAHITKAQEGADRRPFGSAFWHNSPRATWYAKLADRDPGGTVSRLGLYPRKWNLGPLPASVGLELVFAADRTTVRRVDLADTPELAAALTVRHRMARALSGGPRSTSEIAEEIGTSPATVRENVRRHPQQFRRVGDVIQLVEATR